MKTTKKLGIIGGLGPAASAHLYSTVTRLTEADCDQQHIEITLLSRPGIPNRSAFILGESDINPLPAITEAAETLRLLGVDYIVIPCVTAHYFIDEIRESCKVPVISIIEETVKYLQQKSFKSAAIFASDGTISSRIFHTALENAGIRPVVPTPAGQSEVMAIINAVKAGKSVDCPKYKAFTRLAEECSEKGAEVILLACTELSLLPSIVDLSGLNVKIADCAEILARSAVILCGGKIRRFSPLP